MNHEVWATDSLRSLLAPRSVAVVGASAKRGSFGNTTVLNLFASGYAGSILPVNPRYSEIEGLRCYPSLADLPAPADCVVIMLPAELVVETAHSAAMQGSGSVLINSSGFAESGEGQGASREAELRTISWASGMPILGPNCNGLLSFTDKLAINFSPGFGDFVASNQVESGLAVVSQSGAMGSFLLHARENGTRFSSFVSTGNSAAVDVGDCVDYFARDERVTAICLLFEGLRPGTRLLDALALAEQNNVPVVALKTGASRSGRRAAMSHTGSAAGDDRAGRAALDARGVFVVNSLEEIVESASFLAKTRRRRPPATGLGIVTGSGGAGVLACDLAERSHLPLAALTDETTAQIVSRLPSFSTVANPVDITAAGAERRDSLPDVVADVAADPNVGSVLVALGVTVGPEGPTQNRPRAFADLADTLEVPLAVVWLSQNPGHSGAKILEASEHAGVFHSMELCMRTLAHLHRMSELAAAREAAPRAEPHSRHLERADRESIDRWLSQLGEARTADEMEGYELFETLGIRTVPRAFCAVEEDPSAVFASWDNWPSVLKVVSADIAHKAAVGGVLLGLNDVTAVTKGVERIRADIRNRAPDAHVRGFMLQQMVAGAREVFIGAYRDPIYGPVLAVGPGGAAAGEDGLSVVVAAPLDRFRARDAVARSVPRLGASESDSVSDLLMKVDSLMAIAPEVADVDINPVCIDADGTCTAVDAFIRTRPVGEKALE
jgi:acyl-CoA synthetase (NDP forming)